MHSISSNRHLGIYFLRDSVDPAFIYFTFLAHVHPCYVAHAEVKIHDNVPRPQAGTGLTRHLIEAQHLFAILPPVFKRGQHLFEGGIYSKQYGMQRVHACLYCYHAYACTEWGFVIDLVFVCPYVEIQLCICKP